MIAVATAAGGPAPGFEAPGVEDFDLPPIAGIPGLTKPVLELVLSAILIYALFRLAVRKPQLVPGKGQFLGESFHGLVRNSIARDMIGPEFLKYVPFLTTLTFTAIGIRHHGLGGYLRISTWPPDVPWWVRIILTPIEFISNIVLRPVTLSLRLFGNMFAGHLLLLVFILGGQYMLFVADAVTLKILSPFAFLMGIVFTFFEAFVQVVQAYIFVMLTASYIGTVLADDH